MMTGKTAALSSPELCGWQGKHHFPVTELTKLPGMPEKASELHRLAKKQKWRVRPYAGKPEYYFGDFPDETKSHFLEKWFRACEQEGFRGMLSEENVLAMTCSECGQPHLFRFLDRERLICFRHDEEVEF